MPPTQAAKTDRSGGRTDAHAPRVLIAYASKHGTTREIAEEIASVLRAAGLGADVREARQVRTLDAYDAVILGSAIYMTRWRPEARAFVRRHADALKRRALWLFSSGPLDDAATTGELRSPLHAERAAASLGAREHVIFGGALDPDARGFVARRMAQGGLAGDYRDHDRIRAWARAIADALRVPEPQP